MKLLYWVFAAALIVVAVLFALSNRQTVEFGFWPLPYVAEVSVYAFGLGAFAIGFLCGGFFVWLRAITVRGRAKLALRRADRLQQEVNTLRERLDEAEKEAAQSTSVVALSAETPDTLPKVASAR
ncbi:MAG: DUF1049 domain-containing protein [Alphaproteobacteria bacterium]|nr:DUF1049 domain-containing protein [Alphaproteobacteria bacterium]